MDGSRLSKAKKLVNIIIQSLGLDDYVGVITFSDTANILGNLWFKDRYMIIIT